MVELFPQLFRTPLLLNCRLLNVVGELLRLIHFVHRDNVGHEWLHGSVVEEGAVHLQRPRIVALRDLVHAEIELGPVFQLIVEHDSVLVDRILHIRPQSSVPLGRRNARDSS